MTPIESSDATRMRSSGPNFGFFWKSFTNAPQFASRRPWQEAGALGAILRAQDRSRIFRRVDGSAAAASVRAKRPAARQIARSPRRHSVNRWARIGSFRQTKPRSTPYRYAALATPLSRRELVLLPGNSPPRTFHAGGIPNLRLQPFEQPQELARQRLKRTAGHTALRVNDDVPSCG